ncbi:GPN-loop GTPase 3 [Octopus bimaculoides]|uniref:GPN-loop GTPase 3 n=1 Tax=Octopus bimaculoides TaxID=37653 RepID=UPI0022E221EE|nr:GPN-loop GTPase 3 [Octopus bimaculoides]
MRRTVHVVNLDPAAEHFQYSMLADIRELISVEDVMEDPDLKFGPNGGLIFCMDCVVPLFSVPHLLPFTGQIELYTHIPVMRRLVDTLQKWNFNLCAIFCIDSQFMVESSKFISGVLSALSTMVTLEVAHVNVMTKIDLLSKKAKKQLERYLEPDMITLLNEEFNEKKHGNRYHKMNSLMAQMVDDYGLVCFMPLDISEDDNSSLNDILLQVDIAIQYGEDLEPKEPRVSSIWRCPFIPVSVIRLWPHFEEFLL